MSQKSCNQIVERAAIGFIGSLLRYFVYTKTEYSADIIVEVNNLYEVFDSNDYDNEEIFEAYKDLLEVGRRHGVDFESVVLNCFGSKFY